MKEKTEGKIEKNILSATLAASLMPTPAAKPEISSEIKDYLEKIARKPAWYSPSALTSNVTNIAILVLPLLVLWCLIISFKQTYTIDPFKIPKSLTEAGLSGDMLAQRLKMEFNFLAEEQAPNGEVTSPKRINYKSSPNLQERLKSASIPSDMPDFQIPTVSISLSSLVRNIRDAVRLPQSTISVEIEQVGNDLVVSSRLTPNARLAPSVHGSVDDIDGLIRDTAQVLLPLINRKSPSSESGQTEIAAIFDINHNRAVKLLAQNETKAALSYFEADEKIVTERGDVTPSWQFYNDWGQTFSKIGKLRDAVSMFSKALKIDPEAMEPTYNLAASYLELGDYQRAIELFREVLANVPNDPSTLRGMGLALARSGKPEDGLLSLSQAIQADQTYAEGWYTWGDVLAEQGAYNEAVAKYGRVIELFNNDAEPYIDRAIAFHYMRQYDRALEDFGRATEIGPRNVRAWAAFGDLLLDMNDYEGAVSKYKQASELDPKEGSTHAGWCLALARKAQYEAAEQQCKEATQVQPGNIYGWRNWGWLLIQKRAYEEARSKFLRALNINGDDDEALSGLAETEMHLNQYSNAIIDAERALVSSPKSALAYVKMANALKWQRNYIDAENTANQAIKLAPWWGDALAARGWIDYEEGKYNDAMGFFETETKLILIGPKAMSDGVNVLPA